MAPLRDTRRRAAAQDIEVVMGRAANGDDEMNVATVITIEAGIESAD